MRKDGAVRIFWMRLLAAAAAAAFLQGGAGKALAAGTGLISGNYQLNWDQTVDRTPDKVTDVRKFKHTLELKFKGFLSPVVQNEVSFKAEQEMDSNAPDVTRVLPTLDLGVKGAYWDARVGAKRSNETSDDPASPPKTTENYFFEAYYKAPKTIPDFKAKFTLDTDFQEANTDTRKQSVTLSSVYSPKDWLEAKGDYVRNKNDDRITVDSDTEDEKSTGQLGIRRVVSNKIKVEVQGSTELSREAKFVSDTGAAVEGSAKENQTHKWKAALSLRPFVDTSLDGNYDFELKQDKVSGEHTFTKNYKGVLLQRVAKPFDVTVTLNRNTVEAKHTPDDYLKTEDTLTVEGKAKLSRLAQFSLKYQTKDTVEEHLDPTKNTDAGTIVKSATWSGEIGTFWVASATYDRTDTLSSRVTTVIDTKYGLKSTFDFKDLNLTLDPSYDITLKKDLVTPDSTAIRDFKFKLSWKAMPTRNMETKVEHTFGRKVDTGAENIERTDNSTGNLTWRNPFPGWTFAFDVTRAATDKSMDDLPPDITSTFGFKADYKFDRLTMNTAVKYDKKSSSDNTGSFDAKASWAAKDWDTSISYTFKKTFSEEINESYAISLTFKYNL